MGKRMLSIPPYFRVISVACLLILSAISSAHVLPARALTAPESFSDIAEKVTPSVVNIRTEKSVTGGGRVFRHFGGPFGDEDPFDMFERFFGGDPEREFKQRSLGSGFVIDKSGYIVTNNHVIEGADEIQVRLSNDQEYDAEIVGRDPNTDIALIKITQDADLPVVTLGDSDTLKIGQWVVAMGNPFGLEHTVTAGIVSAKGRVIGSGPYDDFIQTDASINPGNSGGPLLNTKGEVVGINTAIIASGQGIGFAVPINLAKDIIDQLQESGEVTRGWLGVAIQDITPEIAEYYGIKEVKGVLVTEVFEDDPAEKAGIRARDIIVSVNGRPVEDTRDLTRLVAGLSVGQKTAVKVLRNGNRETFEVTIARREEEKILSRKDEDRKEEESLGIQVSEISPEIARRYGISEKEGVMVMDVESGSKAEAAGLMAGDIVKEINHEPVGSVEDFRRIIDGVDEGEPINLFIRRINRGFMVVKITK
ncbi:MAG: DegQ family serine endoprotease [Desulfococcaceae bacterium]